MKNACAVIVMALGGCSAAGLAEFEGDDAPACHIDSGGWAGEPAVAAYSQQSLQQVDAAMLEFISALEQASRADTPYSAADFSRMHIQAGDLISELGRLLPRMERALDLAPMISQMKAREIWWPRGGHRTEFLRVAIAEEVVDHQNSAEHTARFLKNFADAEELLLDLKTGGGTPEKRERLHSLALGLTDDWEAASFGFGRVIFDRPNLPEGESFSERIRLRVERYCDAYLECSGPEGSNCGSDPVVRPPAGRDAPQLDEPMGEP